MSTYRVPDGATDEDILMLADVLPTGYEVGVLAGGVRPTLARSRLSSAVAASERGWEQ